MSFEPHYITYYINITVICIAFVMLFYSIFVLCMEALERDKTIMNDPYVKLPKRRKRK